MDPKAKFVMWLKQADPFLYELSMARLARKQSLAAWDWGTIFTTVATTVKDVAPKVIEMRNQKKILDAQIKQMERGEDFRTPPAYQPTVPPSQVQSPQVQELINTTAHQTSGSTTDQLMKFLPFVGLGLLAFKLMKRR